MKNSNSQMRQLHSMLRYESTFRFLYMPMEIIFHRGHERLSDESLGKIFLCVWLLYFINNFC